jgi:hypothetical protein
MTGDGVNDAPALKKANCDIAVSGATDAARAAASIVLTTPGLAVIIEAIKESRKILQRMNSYAIYRIAETLRVLLFMTAAILIFNFYPLTAVMIVMLALLNEGAILSIAYDNVHYKDQPEAWNMRVVLGIATVLGVIGPVAFFGLFYLGDRVFHLDHSHLQPMIYPPSPTASLSGGYRSNTGAVGCFDLFVGANASREIFHCIPVLPQYPRGIIGTLANSAISPDFAIPRQFPETGSELVERDVDRSGNAVFLELFAVAHVQEEQVVGAELPPVGERIVAPQRI